MAGAYVAGTVRFSSSQGPSFQVNREGAIKTEIIAAGLFVAFAALSLVAALSQSRAEEARRRAVSLFLAFTLVALVSPGFLRREAWPFSRWELMAYHYRPPVEIGNIEIRGVDGHGLEWAIDRRAWEPFSSLDLFTWANYNWRQLAAKDQAIAGKYLLNLVNRNRAVAASGHRPGVFGRYFGPLAAPLHVVYRPIWDNPSAVPPAPFVLLRIYKNVWDVERRDRDPKDSRRELMYEGPRPEGDEDKR